MEQRMSQSSHILVDLDGTLAKYYPGETNIGPPILPMLTRVKTWITQGLDVRIFTARASVPELVPEVEEWCLLHLGKKIPVTNSKDFGTMEIWDDRAIRVKFNTGEI